MQTNDPKQLLANKRFLFLDRDGVINKRIIGGYITNPEAFECLDGVPEAIAIFNKHFERVFVVTNQQGIGKGLMTDEDLKAVHNHLSDILVEAGGYIDAFYYCKHLVNSKENCRKPSPAMGLQAQADFPEVDFSQSLMVGDMVSDLQFAHALEMPGILIESAHSMPQAKATADMRVPSLLHLAHMIQDL